MAKNTLLYKDSYREWLASLDPLEIIAQPRNAEACPIAIFLNQKTGRKWTVSSFHCVPIDERWAMAWDGTQTLSEFHTPKWAAEYIKTFDASYRHEINITAEQALWVFDEVIR